MDTVSAKLREAGLRRVVVVRVSPGGGLNCDAVMVTDAQFEQLEAWLREVRD